MASEKILIVGADAQIGTRLEQDVLAPAGFTVTFVAEGKMAVELLRQSPHDLAILSNRLLDGDGLEFGARLAERIPALPIILIAPDLTLAACVQALRQGFWDCVPASVQAVDLYKVIDQCLSRRQRLKSWAQNEARRTSSGLQKRLDAVESLQQVGRSVTSILELDTILTAVVDAAVDLTGAEEGSLLLLDESTGELYMRAARNFQDDFVRKFRLPMRESLAGQVVRTGKAITFDNTVPQKIKTSYLVHTLIYVPLVVHKRVIGVLGVDNRQGGHPFLDEHLALITTLADYAAIAIENARIYASVELERKKLETILTKVEDCVIVVDHDGRLVIANHAAQTAFGLQGNLTAQPVANFMPHQDLLDIFQRSNSTSSRSEIHLDDGRVFNAQITPIPEVGVVVTMQDITHLKELDRIKSEFVSTVSHDLRSPLTAILGYVELIGRVGPVTDQQKEFISRVQVSVHNITALINDLLELGRIEAGFDARNEVTPFAAIIQSAVDGLAPKIHDKAQILTMDVPEDLPNVVGNPARLRQLILNLLGNAVKYSARGGKIVLHAHSEAGQIIFQISDTGPGIPTNDQPYIFDKFYRASNVSSELSGSGLGLAIVKSIVEHHGGRIWVDSIEGKGSTFTVVLPVARNEGLTEV